MLYIYLHNLAHSINTRFAKTLVACGWLLRAWSFPASRPRDRPRDRRAAHGIQAGSHTRLPTTPSQSLDTDPFSASPPASLLPHTHNRHVCTRLKPIRCTFHHSRGRGLKLLRSLHPRPSSRLLAPHTSLLVTNTLTKLVPPMSAGTAARRSRGHVEQHRYPSSSGLS